LLKQLLTDIEHPRFGGNGCIKNKKEAGVKIVSRYPNVIENERKETAVALLHHNKGSELRKKIGRNVQHWEELSRGDYFGKLHMPAYTHHPKAHLCTDDGPKIPLVIVSPHAKKNKKAAARLFYQFSALSEDKKPPPEKPPPSTLNFTQY
jgi:hypothetical protein